MPLSDKRKLGQKDSVSKGDKFSQELSAKGLCKDASASKCVWARVKGYPWWPVSFEIIDIRPLGTLAASEASRGFSCSGVVLVAGEVFFAAHGSMHLQ